MNIVTMSMPKRTKLARGEKDWREEFDKMVDKTTLSMSPHKDRKETICFNGVGDLKQVIGYPRAIFALSDDKKLYVIPSDEGMWLYKKGGCWSATATNGKFASSTLGLDGVYRLHKERCKTLETPSMLFYFDLNENIRESVAKTKQVNVQESIPMNDLYWGELQKLRDQNKKIQEQLEKLKEAAK